MKRVIKAAKAIVKTISDIDARNTFVLEEDFEENEDTYFEAFAVCLDTLRERGNRSYPSLSSDDYSSLNDYI